jgi:hypothetical protein
LAQQLGLFDFAQRPSVDFDLRLQLPATHRVPADSEQSVPGLPLVAEPLQISLRQERQ